MAIIDSILDTAKQISKWAAGEGNGISSVMKSSEKEIAQNLMNSKFVNNFNDLGVKASNDIAVDASGKATKSVIKKGDNINIKNMDDFAKYESSIEVPGGDNAGKYEELISDYKKFTDSGGDSLSNEGLRNLYERGDKGGIGYGNMASGYFGDSAKGMKRIGYTAAGVGVGAVGLRTLQGGNLTKTAQGEKNIAGIPFV